MSNFFGLVSFVALPYLLDVVWWKAGIIALCAGLAAVFYITEGQ